MGACVGIWALRGYYKYVVELKRRGWSIGVNVVGSECQAMSNKGKPRIEWRYVEVEARQIPSVIRSHSSGGRSADGREQLPSPS